MLSSLTRSFAAAAASLALVLTAAPSPAGADDPWDAVDLTAVVETAPVANSGDAADDPAIWFNAANPGASRIIGTDKLGALEVYTLSGDRVQRITGVTPNNVDIRGDIVATAEDERSRVEVYRVSSGGTLSSLGYVTSDVVAHGICMYRSPWSGKLYAFANDYVGRVQQIEITPGATSFTWRKVRTFDVGTAVEGCEVDDATGRLFIGEELHGLWRYGAEPAAGTSRTLVDTVATNGGHLVADVEGVTAAGAFLIVSSQGDSEFAVYDRSSLAYLGRFDVDSGSLVDGCSETDGIDATSAPLGSAFPRGVFICQDGSNGTPGNSGSQNFKFVDFGTIDAEF